MDLSSKKMNHTRSRSPVVDKSRLRAVKSLADLDYLRSFEEQARLEVEKYFEGLAPDSPLRELNPRLKQHIIVMLLDPVRDVSNDPVSSSLESRLSSNAPEDIASFIQQRIDAINRAADQSSHQQDAPLPVEALTPPSPQDKPETKTEAAAMQEYLEDTEIMIKGLTVAAEAWQRMENCPYRRVGEQKYSRESRDFLGRMASVAESLNKLREDLPKNPLGRTGFRDNLRLVTVSEILRLATGDYQDEDLATLLANIHGEEKDQSYERSIPKRRERFRSSHPVQFAAAEKEASAIFDRAEFEHKHSRSSLYAGLIPQASEQPPGNSIKVWTPCSSEFEAHNFLVENLDGRLKMTRQEYEMRLHARLKEAVGDAEAEHPGSAKDLLTDSPEHNPTLHQIGMGADLKDYPSQILNCDQMQMLLNQIDWNEDGYTFELERSDFPSLQEICQSMPS